MSDKLDDLQRRLDDAKGPPDLGPLESSAPKDVGNAMKLGVELLAGIIIGVTIGYGLDQWFNSSPWLLMVGFLMGIGAGVVNMKRAVDRLDTGQ